MELNFENKAIEFILNYTMGKNPQTSYKSQKVQMPVAL